MTVVTVDFEQTSWIILRTVRDCDPARILAASGFVQQSTHNGRQYHINQEGAGLLFIDNRTLVVGPERGIQHCIDLPRKRMQGPLTEAIRLASRNEHHAVAGVNGPRLASRLKAEDGRTGKALKAVGLLEAETLTATASVAGKVDVEVRVDFPTAEQASQVVRFIPGSLLVAQLALMGMEVIPGDFFPGVDGRRLKMLAGKCLSQLKPKQDGARVRFQVGIEIKDLLEVFGVADKGARE